MRYRLILYASVLLLTAPLLSLSYIPTCDVKAITPAQEDWQPGRMVTVEPINCPPTGMAYVRFRSGRTIQPASPPGHFTLRAGQRLTRRVPGDWWVERRDKGLQWLRVVIRQGGK